MHAILSDYLYLQKLEKSAVSDGKLHTVLYIIIGLEVLSTAKLQTLSDMVRVRLKLAGIIILRLQR